MKRKYLVAALLLMMGAGANSYAQNWSGIIAPNRATDWSVAGTTGGIPNRTTICATLNPGASVSQINAAIASCPANQVVFLNAGTYSGLSGQIFFNNKSNVTLRGAGPDKTFLVFSSGSDCNGLGSNICIMNADSNYSGDPHNTANWTAGYAPGTTSITLSSVANLKVGSLLILDQLDDSTDTGNIYLCQTTNGCSWQGGIGNGRPGRAQNQTVTVTSINGNTVGISPAIRAPNWRTSQAPGAWWSSAVAVSGDGIEALSVDSRSVNNQSGSAFMMVNATNSWISNVRSLNANLHKHVWLYQSAHITVRDSYFYGAQGASESYGVDGVSSADTLVENNICQHIATCMINEGNSGWVYGYNFVIDNYYTAGGSATDWQQADSYHHSVGDYMILWEGNSGIAFTADAIHGSSFMLTLFRNYYNGRDPNGGGTKTTNTIAAQLMTWNRYLNLVGNVLGTPGYHTVYTSAATGTSDGAANGSKSVFALGYSDGAGGHYAGINNDVMVKSTLFRWGNYALCTGDSLCNSSRFDSSEVPSGLSMYANPVPASQTLPASFYLNSKPAWWGSAPWPAIGPDVSGGNQANTAGHVNKIPAQLCYENTSQTNGILNFSATACYSQNRPAPPTNVTLLVQ